MKHLNWLTLLLLSIFNISCSNAGDERSKEETSISTPTTNSAAVISPQNTVIAFLKWYKQNEERLRAIQLIKGGLEDTTTYYSVDFDGTRKYINELKSSSYLSDKYLNDLGRHFINADKYLKLHPQNDGPAPGFDADLVMKSQDYMDVWDSIDKSKMVSEKTTGNQCYIKLSFGGVERQFNLSNATGRWFIDVIEGPFEI